MNQKELCCLGHITLDKVVTPRQTVHMPGGTAFYFAHAMRQIEGVDFSLVTAVAQSEMNVVEDLRSKGVDVLALPSEHSVCFANIYGENQNERKQRVTAKAASFNCAQLADVNAEIFHLGSLLADDFPLETVKYLSTKGKVSVDSQGFLREVRGEEVFAIDWKEKNDFLPYVYFLKVDEHEMEVLTGFTDVRKAAVRLNEWGVKEVIITLGDRGSVIYDGHIFYRIPAYRPKEIVDATGCGDTYMTGYLYQKALGKSIEECGCFAAAMSSIKIEAMGPFKGTKEKIQDYIDHAEALYGPEKLL